ncbi:MAG: DUF4922 domain-containing protein [Candidatus Latescibacterota bacterium]
MTWQGVLIDSAEPGTDLRPALTRLFERARETWPLWRAGQDALASVRVKELRDGDGRVLVQTNPGRSRSVHAAVDPAPIAARPCFLCPQSFPPGECGVAWGDLALLPNPFPVLVQHLAVPSLRHEPQALAGRATDLVHLAQGLGSGMVAFYNGPRCGASAPDHFHFQACAAVVPAFELLPPEGPARGPHAITSFGRRFVALVDDDAARLAARIEAALHAWGSLQTTREGEPMCNVLVRWQGSHGTALFFPRRAHRPAVFHADAAERIAVSPGTIEMSGILVVPDALSFQRLDARAARSVFEDVSPTPPQFAAFLEQIP